MEKSVFSFHVYLELHQSWTLCVDDYFVLHFFEYVFIWWEATISGVPWVKGVCSGSFYIWECVLPTGSYSYWNEAKEEGIAAQKKNI